MTSMRWRPREQAEAAQEQSGGALNVEAQKQDGSAWWEDMQHSKASSSSSKAWYSKQDSSWEEGSYWYDRNDRRTPNTKSIMKLLSGTWHGKVGESYAFDFTGGTDAWICTKMTKSAEKGYQSFFDADSNCVIWGASKYYLDCSELLSCPWVAKWYYWEVPSGGRPVFTWEKGDDGTTGLQNTRTEFQEDCSWAVQEDWNTWAAKGSGKNAKAEGEGKGKGKAKAEGKGKDKEKTEGDEAEATAVAKGAWQWKEKISTEDADASAAAEFAAAAVKLKKAKSEGNSKSKADKGKAAAKATAEVEPAVEQDDGGKRAFEMAMAEFETARKAAKEATSVEKKAKLTNRPDAALPTPFAPGLVTAESILAAGTAGGSSSSKAVAPEASAQTKPPGHQEEMRGFKGDGICGDYQRDLCNRGSHCKFAHVLYGTPQALMLQQAAAALQAEMIAKMKDKAKGTSQPEPTQPTQSTQPTQPMQLMQTQGMPPVQLAIEQRPQLPTETAAVPSTNPGEIQDDKKSTPDWEANLQKLIHRQQQIQEERKVGLSQEERRLVGKIVSSEEPLVIPSPHGVTAAELRPDARSARPEPWQRREQPRSSPADSADRGARRIDWLDKNGNAFVRQPRPKQGTRQRKVEVQKDDGKHQQMLWQVLLPFAILLGFWLVVDGTLVRVFRAFAGA